ncbi:IAA acetyltransferase [Pseudomonas aeruginosa PA38182]|nr:IAA acetyltransferase [Pseudomonas aeruginosa PA38182]
MRIELGTGTFGYQLAFYQRVGFRVDKVVKNYFLDNYDQPIYEMGIQHKDMLRLSLIL